MYQLHEAQKVIAKDTHRFRVISCGRRFGKTTLASLEMIAKAVSKDEQRIAYIAPTHQQARDIAWAELKKICQPILVNANETRLELTVKAQKSGTSQIWLRGWESVETLRGQRFDFIVVDEIASMRHWQENWEAVISPTLTDTAGHAMFISTPKGFDHFYDLFNEERRNKDFKSFHFTSYDNPFLPVAELEAARDRSNEDYFAQEYLADFRKRVGLVYPEFDRQKHIYTGEPAGRTNETLVGIDWGYTNPAAIITVKRDHDDRFWVPDEWYKPGKTTDDIIEVASLTRASAYYPDPAEPDRIEMLKRRGLNVREVSKDVVAGIDVVRNLFKTDRIRIHAGCTNLIHELETYAYKEKRADSNEPEEPVKENDHLVDAMRYVLYSQSLARPKMRTQQFIPNYSAQTYGRREQSVNR